MRTKESTPTGESTRDCGARLSSPRLVKSRRKPAHRRRYQATAALLVSLAIAGCGPDVLDDPQAARGQELFARCSACHAADRPLTKVGPHLVGVFGRTAGALDGFPYSEALMDSGLVWDDATLTAFLRNPRELVPGNRMAFVGMREDADIAAVIAYLRAVSGPEE